MGVFGKIRADHEKKSKQLRELKKKMRNRIPISKLKEMLAHEKRYKVNWQDYHGWNGVDDDAYSIDVARQEARIQLLEELIRKYG
jgi:predicted outer membrane protein